MRGAIHDVTIVKMMAGAPDAEYRHGYAENRRFDVRGRVMMIHAAEREIADRFGENITALANMPINTDITEVDRVEIDGVHPTLDGVYEVGAVEFTPTLLQVWLRRTGVQAS